MICRTRDTRESSLWALEERSSDCGRGSGDASAIVSAIRKMKIFTSSLLLIYLIQMYLSKSLVALVTLVGFLVSVNEHV